MTAEPLLPEMIEVLAYWMAHCPLRCRQAIHAPGGLRAAVLDAWREAEPRLIVQLAADPTLSLSAAARHDPHLCPPPERWDS